MKILDSTNFWKKNSHNPSCLTVGWSVGWSVSQLVSKRVGSYSFKLPSEHFLIGEDYHNVAQFGGWGSHNVAQFGKMLNWLDFSVNYRLNSLIKHFE